MSTKLVIVESPSKSKTIEQYLGKEYTVLSSKGHIRDLAISGAGGLGLDIENDFQPKYDIIKEKKKVVRESKIVEGQFRVSEDTAALKRNIDKINPDDIDTEDDWYIAESLLLRKGEC